VPEPTCNCREVEAGRDFRPTGPLGLLGTDGYSSRFVCKTCGRQWVEEVSDSESEHLETWTPVEAQAR
jgi:hypothetical protein